LQQVSDEAVIAPNKIHAEHGKMAVGIGHGWRTYVAELSQLVKANELFILPDALPAAKEVAFLAKEAVRNGHTVAAESAQPVYLRDNVAKKKAQQ
jgi:tRNA threonylcarbamoyladenosine biosynthesis protein TsaB